MKKNVDNDTLIPFIRCHMYAQINRNGDCILTKYLYQQPRQFIKYKLDTDSLNEVISFIDKFSKDTSLTAKCISCLYDGPIIKIINHKVTENPVYLSFSDSERSNQKFVRFYKYLDSIVMDSNNINYVDTLQISNSERLLLAKIFDLEMKYVPIVLEEKVQEE